MPRNLMIVPDSGTAENLAELLPELLVSTNYQPGPWRSIIRWGASDGRDDAEVVLNRASVLSSPELISAIRERWAASRVPRYTGESAQVIRFYKRYRVYLFDTEPILLQRREIGRRGVQTVRSGLSRETRQVSELAVRALYLAGLDAGSVDIGLSSHGKLYVTSCNGGPQLSKRLAKVYARYINGWLKRVEARWTASLLAEIREGKQGSCPRFLIGADPEFMMRNVRTGRMAFASDFFPMEGTVGCDARRVTAGRSGYPLAEVRPRPAVCPLEVYENTRQALVRAARLAPYRNIQWRAGTLPFRRLSVGGHIHFGMRPTGQLLRALDTYLAVLFLLVENPAAARVRRSRYGYLGDFRLKDHGGFEYRVIPSWLVNPMFTRGALCLAKVIGCDWPKLQRDLFQAPDALRAFRAADQSYFRQQLPMLLSDLRSLDSYRQYAEHIEPFLDWVESERRWKTGGDLRRNWRLRVSRRSKP